MVEFLPYGTVLYGNDTEVLQTDAARRTLSAIKGSKGEFEFVELRALEETEKPVDIIVVDCISTGVPSQNVVGIKNRERLALVFPHSCGAPEVRALRKNFPDTMHRNQVDVGEPASLCLYYEIWSHHERLWTPQKHLKRVVEWLERASKGELHRENQPVEQFYLDSPAELILPPEYETKITEREKCLVLHRKSKAEEKYVVIEGHFVNLSAAENSLYRPFLPLIITTDVVVHDSILPCPNSFGELEAQLAQRGVNFFPLFCGVLKQLVGSQGIKRNPENRVVLILNLPVKRAEDKKKENTERRAFTTTCDLVEIGEAAGLLSKTGREGDEQYYYPEILGTPPSISTPKWQQIQICQINVRTRNSRDFARIASGIESENSDFLGIVAGVGALGGALADLWSRESWGQWTLIDPDRFVPHNTVRHIAKDDHVGDYKVDAVKCFLEANYYPGYVSVEAIRDSATNFENAGVIKALSQSELLIDATTTLNVPRDLSRRDKAPRAMSTFLTPSGFGAVLLAEDKERKVRLAHLEAQYYRDIINNDWGKTHLDKHRGDMFVGGGCRDVSLVMSFESVQMFAGILARQIRSAHGASEARIHIWHSNPATGAVDCFQCPVSKPIQLDIGKWRILLDEAFQEKLIRMRNAGLPKETGGVLLGYIDHKSKTIFVVDALPAPADSESDCDGFIRGVSGLPEKMNDVRKRTANIVDYIGEWHSHPPKISSRPSGADHGLLSYLSDALSQDGQPALMIIAGERDIRVLIQEDL